jgi:hypothetical protein
MTRNLLSLVTLSFFCACSALAAGTPRPADVYILSGQSNMQGAGLLAELSEDDRKPPAPNRRNFYPGENADHEKVTDDLIFVGHQCGL